MEDYGVEEVLRGRRVSGVGVERGHWGMTDRYQESI